MFIIIIIIFGFQGSFTIKIKKYLFISYQYRNEKQAMLKNFNALKSQR